MQKKRWRKLGLVRKWLTCAIGVIALMALLSAHVHIFPHSQVPSLFESYKLPTQHEIGYQRLSREQLSTPILAPPHLFKAPLPSRKLDGASGSLDFNKLWRPPQNRDYGPCVESSSSYTPYGESRGYLLVHTNGGLNQMRAGVYNLSLSPPHMKNLN